ncbi:MAG: thioredoxin family protein [Cyclobacteriaceae bacterium]|jgi:peroxiredoxin
MKTTFLMMLFALLWAGSPVKEGYEIGDTAADFKLKNVDGKMVSLADFKDAKGFIVVFDCNTCPVSKAYNERIIELNAKYAGLGFPVIAVNPNDPSKSKGDTFEENVRYAKKKGYTFPYLEDAGQNVTKAFGATNTPHVFVLTKELKVAYIGSIDNSTRPAEATKFFVQDAVNALLEGKSVPVTKTKAIGCTIKWKDA